MKKLQLLIFGILMVINCYSQGDFRSAYIVKTNNDTIWGYVDYLRPADLLTQCMFCKMKGGGIIYYQPQGLKSFGFVGANQYVSKVVTIDGEKQLFFLEYLLKGSVNLYYCKYKLEDFYFIEKDNQFYQLENEDVEVVEKDRTIRHKNHKYIGILKVLLSDVPSLSDKIDRTSLDFQSLISLLKEYNDQVCSSEKCVVYYKSDRKLNTVKWKLKLGVAMDYTISKVSYSGNIINSTTTVSYEPNSNPIRVYTATFDRYKNIQTNADFDQKKETFFPSVFLNISRNSANSYQLEFKYKYLNYADLKYNEIEIPLMYNYDFMLHSKIKPILSAGVSNVIIWGTKSNDLYFNYDEIASTTFVTDKFVAEYSNRQDYFSNDIKLLNHYWFKFNLGAGVGYLLPNKDMIKLDFRLQSPLIYTNTGLLRDRVVYTTEFNEHVRLVFSLNYMFK